LGHLCRSFCPPLLIRFPEGYQVCHVLEPIRNASGHRRSHAQCTMNLDEIVREVV
jgi:hypothetical protein